MTSISCRLQNMVLKIKKPQKPPPTPPNPNSDPNPNRVFSMFFFSDTAKCMGATHSRKENLY